MQCIAELHVIRKSLLFYLELDYKIGELIRFKHFSLRQLIIVHYVMSISVS